MSYETGTATGMEDVYVKFFNFLQANGWTADVDWVSASQSPAYGIIHRKANLSPEDETTVNLHCGFARADNFGGTPEFRSNMIPMLDYVSGAPNEGIRVATSTGTYTSGTSHIIGNWMSTPFENYWFFESDYYAHAIVEWKVGFFRHFGMGQLNKIGKWIGGEYYYNGYWSQSVSTIDQPITSNSHKVLLEGRYTTDATAGMMHGKLMDGSPFPDLAGRQSPDSVWHAFAQNGDSGVGAGTDADGADCGGVVGLGARAGFHYPLYWLGQIPFNGYRPMHPLTVYTNYTSGAPDNMNPLGTMPDVRTISMEGALSAGDEFTVGSDTWKVFPACRKLPEHDTSGPNKDTEQSLSWGIAYKKVLT